MSKHFSNIFRSLFAAVLLFEFFNLIEVFDFPLDFSWFGLMATAAFVWSLTEFFSHYLDARSYLPYMLFFSFVSIFLDMIGDVLRLYSRFLWYDSFAHFLSGITVSLVLFLLGRNYFEKHKIPDRVQYFVVIGICNIIGVLYEGEEFFEDLFLGRKMFRLGDGPDTVTDLLMNLLGSAIFILILTIDRRNRPTPPLSSP